jgi:hypothetical protein
MLSVIMLCHYAECHYGVSWRPLSNLSFDALLLTLKGDDKYNFIALPYANLPYQGILTEGEGSVQLTSLYQLVQKNVFLFLQNKLS